MQEGYALIPATDADVNSWMALVQTVGDNFPGLDIDAYQDMLLRNIHRQSALCVKQGAQVVGVLLYSLNHQTLSCMAVHPAHRRRGIGAALVGKMLEDMPKDSDIWVSTFREEDPWGTAPRALYKRFGFVEDALTMEFDYPNQKFVLRRKG